MWIDATLDGSIEALVDLLGEVSVVELIQVVQVRVSAASDDRARFQPPTTRAPRSCVGVLVVRRDDMMHNGLMK